MVEACLSRRGRAGEARFGIESSVLAPCDLVWQEWSGGDFEPGSGMDMRGKAGMESSGKVSRSVVWLVQAMSGLARQEWHGWRSPVWPDAGVKAE